MSTTIRIALIFFTFLTFFIFLHFIRKFKLNIKYSILWILIALLLVFLGIFPELFIIISYKIGFLSTVNMIYLIIIFILICIVFYLTINLSSLEEKLKIAIFEIALMKKELEENKRKD
ncbi:DUF2304 domain-containing protein [Holdemania sp. 1001302B_160321_E10]|uniref:DUF2304 domain-containing protein n=1 Tax=Holdemania sp. 1001302B_160321_E10 TaxID=2787120 RepID=UPI0018979F0F|nr:DUF2304 domain-containing protein [Holdemania sp. 1001302B_160321_E10]